MRRESPGDRFWRFVDKSGPCWLWIGGIHRTGYGHFKVAKKTHLAHRFSYLEERGAIPEGLVLDHLCRVKHCVNPEHLEPVTPGENQRRGDHSPQIAHSKARAAVRTHCPKGHPYSGENLIQKPNCRVCRECARAAWRDNKRRKRWELLDQEELEDVA